MAPTEPQLTADLVLREKLASERTHLANERTLLAYSRTGLAFLVAGVSGAQLLDSAFWKVLSWVFILLGPTVMALGVWRFMARRRALHSASPSDAEGPARGAADPAARTAP